MLYPWFTELFGSISLENFFGLGKWGCRYFLYKYEGVYAWWDSCIWVSTYAARMTIKYRPLHFSEEDRVSENPGPKGGQAYEPALLNVIHLKSERTATNGANVTFLN